MPLSIAALAIGGVVAWNACAIYDASLLLPGAARDAGTDAASPPPPTVDGGQIDGDVCALARWPARPSADDPSSTPDTEVVVAAATVSFGAEDGGAAPIRGFDLDGVCTCPGPDSCLNARTGPHCDEPEGRDNAGESLLELVSTFGLTAASIDQSLAAGKYGLVVQVKNWNGQPNDTSVSVAIYVSNGLSGKEDGGTVGPTKGDGTDRWSVSPESVIGGTALLGVDCGNDNPACAPAHLDDNAYVTGSVLVGSLNFPISIGAGNGAVVLNLTGSVVVAELVPQTGGWGLTSGVIAGRWATAPLLSGFAALKDPTSTTGEYLCGSDPLYQLVRTQICDGMEVTTDPSLDETGAQCDALSVAVGFTANPALMAEVYGTGSATQGCVSDAGTPFYDDCTQ